MGNPHRKMSLDQPPEAPAHQDHCVSENGTGIEECQEHPETPGTP